MPSAAPSLSIAVLGCGTVGTQVVRLLLEQGEELSARAGTRLELAGIAVRSLETERDPVVPRDLLTTDAESLVERADVVVELMGGTERARDLILRGIEAGASVVTANKALLASQYGELFSRADAAGVDLLFEAAVAGAVPVVRGVRESLAGDRIERVIGIMNGTTNYVLDAMTTAGWDVDAAVTRAQELGYAEADPTADVDGHDAAAKAAILAALAFHTRVDLRDVTREGIRGVTPEDIEAAREAGGVIKLLGIAERVATPQGERVAVQVHPAVLPLEHPLASVRGAFNAVVLEAQAAGRLMFYGAGAGGPETASAVLGDVVAAARHRVTGGRAPAESTHATLAPARPADLGARMQIRLRVADRPGVLAHVSTALAQHGVSIESVRQRPGDDGSATLTVVTHEARLDALLRTTAALQATTGVEELLSAYRVEQA